MAKLPKGFRGARPSDPDEAKSKLKEALESTADEIDVASRVRSFKNRDGSVDAELLLSELPRNVSIVNLLREARMGTASRVPGAWISVGLRYALDDEDITSPDFKYRGMGDAGSYYRRATPEGILEAFETAARIDSNMKRKKRNRASQLFVRLHWNEADERPKMRGESGRERRSRLFKPRGK